MAENQFGGDVNFNTPYNTNSFVTQPNSDSTNTYWDSGSSQHMSLKYKPLDEIVNHKSLKYTFIPLPDHERAQTVESYNKFYNAKSEKNATVFYVEGRPCDTPEGKKLVSKLFNLAQEVFKKNYKPSEAVIVFHGKEGAAEQERHIRDCVITDVGLLISNKQNQITVRITMQGILEGDDDR
jgi:hypothetical protein